MSESTNTQISFVLNGRPVKATVQTHYSVLDVLRNTFELYGARESCAQGLCGCCTVIVDGKSVSGCLALAADLRFNKPLLIAVPFNAGFVPRASCS